MARLSYVLKDLLKGLPAISPLSFLLGIKRPRALPILHSSLLRAYMAQSGRLAPLIRPTELLGSNGPVNMRLGDFGVYPFYEEQYRLLELVALLKPRTAFEIGTYRGYLAVLIVANMPEGGKIYTLDLPGGDEIPDHASDLHYIKAAGSIVGEFFRDTPWNGTKIHQLRGNSLTFDFSPYYDAMDFVLVDASHTYEAVFSDSMNAFRMIKPGGVIAWHDYGSMRSEYGVNRFCDTLRLKHNLPVHRLGDACTDTRYAVLRVTLEIKEVLMGLAAEPESFTNGGQTRKLLLNAAAKQ